MSARWTVAAGRLLEFDGQPFISVNKEGATQPVEADGFVHVVADLLNRSGDTPDSIYERQMGHPPRRRVVRERSDRPISMTFGTVPPFAEFITDIRRPDPDNTDGEAYWPEGTLYPMELVDGNEIDLVERFGDLHSFASRYSHKAGFRGDEREIYNLLVFLTGEGNEEADNLASSIMTTLGYEWI